MGVAAHGSGGCSVQGGRGPKRSAPPLAEVVDGSELEQLPLPPRYLEDGTPSREYYTVQIENLNRLARRSQLERGEVIKGYDQNLKGILTAASFDGFRPGDVMDRRTESEKLGEVVERLLEVPGAILEATDEELNALEREMRKAVDFAQELIERANENAGEPMPQAEPVEPEEGTVD
jgi:hypothetical protein